MQSYLARRQVTHTNHYLGADEIEAASVGTQVDVFFAGAQQAQLVSIAAGRFSVHLTVIKERAE